VTRRTAVVAIALAGFLAPELRAQCPDGSAPPCRSAVVAAAPRRANPPLDERTWIVMPFDNVAKNQEIDWLRNGSVNLLYLGMSRWTDVRVIDDERVADLVRDVPEAANASTLSLNAGLAVARRAGAGRLVMGDFIKLGSRTAVTAKVFDVKNGQRVRSVSDQTQIADSVMPMFGKLAQKILNVTVPAGAGAGIVGTTSIAAYREYLRGVQALNGFRIEEARQALNKALELDSTFALAHYKLAVLSGWDGGLGAREHVEAAARLATSLPERERALINGHLWHQRQELGRACEIFSGLLRADSTDLDAWYGLGDCLYHDNVIEPINGDTTRMRFRGDFNASVRAFRKALELDPSFHLAYQHIVDAYLTDWRLGTRCVDQRCFRYAAFAINLSDTFALKPIALEDQAAIAAQADQHHRSLSRRRNGVVAYNIAQNWVASSPNESRARMALVNVLLAMGNLDEAALELAKVGGGTGVADQFTALMRAEVAIKQWRGAEARRLYDSLRALPSPRAGQPGVGSVVQLGVGSVVAQMAPALGRITEYDSLTPAPQNQPARSRRRKAVTRLMLGLPVDSLEAIDRAAFDEALASPAGRTAATPAVASSLAFGLRLRRASWLPIDTVNAASLYRPAIALMRQDTSALRSAARHLDSLSMVFVASLTPDTAHAAVAAEAYLALGDSAAALRMTRRMLDSALAFTPLYQRSILGQSYAVLVARVALQRADLAAALGRRDEALLWYRRFIDLWANPEPELRPMLDRARRAYAALGGT
jgi:tetratricopeptide (TPR) repeat protein/TolB-like protein